MALDEPLKGDKTQEINGLRFIVEESLLDRCKGFSISSVKYGPQVFFNVVPDIAPDSDGGGCSSCTSCG